MAYKVSRFGWLPDLPDQRDVAYNAQAATLRKLPAKVDLRPQMPPVLDQGTLGSCTSQALSTVYQFDLIRQKARDFTPSRLFIYYSQRMGRQSTQSDCGAAFREGLKSLKTTGVCPENMWPYQAERFPDRPANSCYTEALRHMALSYHRVPRKLNQMKACLAEGNPFTFGFVAYESFESETLSATGKLNLPKKDEAPLGGHAGVIVGYDEKAKRFIARNSWGPNWGQAGYFTIPYEYLLDENLSNDFWVLHVTPAATARQLKQAVLPTSAPIIDRVTRPYFAEKTTATRSTERTFRNAY